MFYHQVKEDSSQLKNYPGLDFTPPNKTKIPSYLEYGPTKQNKLLHYRNIHQD